jgi:hypothetical protein
MQVEEESQDQGNYWSIVADLGGGFSPWSLVGGLAWPMLLEPQTLSTPETLPLDQFPSVRRDCLARFGSLWCHCKVAKYISVGHCRVPDNALWGGPRWGIWDREEGTAHDAGPCLALLSSYLGRFFLADREIESCMSM